MTDIRKDIKLTKIEVQLCERAAEIYQETGWIVCGGRSSGQGFNYCSTLHCPCGASRERALRDLERLSHGS